LKSTGIVAAASVLAAAGCVSAAAAAAAPDGVRGYSAVALSPSGEQIAYVETVDPFTDVRQAPHGHIVVRAARGGALIGSYDPCETCRYTGLAWSPDGRTLAFLASDSKTHKASLLTLTGNKIMTVAQLAGVAGTPRWSPDGATLAVLATAGAHKQTGAVEAGAAQVGEIDAVETEDEQRIAIVPATSGQLRYVSPADTFIYEYDWTPDGRGFVATAAKGNGDNNWWVAKLEAIDLASGAARVIAAPKIQMNMPRVSPDGRTVSFIGGLMSDFGSIGGDVYTVDFAGGEPSDVTPNYAGTFTSLVQRKDGLYATALIGDRMAVARLEPASHGVTILRATPTSISAGDGHVALSADSRVAALVEQDFEVAPHILVGPISALAPVTHDNDALKPQVSARSVHWKNDGFEVQGWLLGPKGAPEPGKLHPMIVIVHGGPSAATTPDYLPEHTSGAVRGPMPELIAKGYYIFEPNPRGSYGQGEAFSRANVRDFGGGDLRDVLAGVDAVEKIAPVDDKRLGVFGHSYGGYMTMWTVTHSHRFHAAVAGAGIADWISYYGENGIDQWMIPFFGASAYDDPAIYEKGSPIFSIKTATTPTLVYVGERDVECPAPQSFEFWHGLKAAGVPTSLVVYAGQGHAIHDPNDLQDLRGREIAWFDKYLQP
jgi:dipeptidyl aminopeptidase/acylaminoacyl peptidase